MKKKALNRVFPLDRDGHDAIIETLEILSGRRGNKFLVPVARTLTFSSPPTKAECEALYSFVKEVRAGVVAIMERMDG